MPFPHRARVIRRVSDYDAKGNPRIARDRKTGLSMRRVKAASDHDCQAGTSCTYIGNILDRYTILAGTYYAKVVTPANGRRFGPQRWPTERNYHPECVPSEAKPLVRFLFPETTRPS